MILKSVEAKSVFAGMLGTVVHLHKNGEVTVELGDGKGKIIAMITGDASEFSKIYQQNIIDLAREMEDEE
jgi:hypothetical protein